MSLTEFSAKAVENLNAQDTKSELLLDTVINAANEISNDSDVTTVPDADGSGTHESGEISWGGKTSNLQGTGGVALLEFAKDAIQTAVSNISGVSTLRTQLQKVTERKIANQ